MALVTESANRVRQKTFMINWNPGVFYGLKALFLHLAANKGNPDLFIKNVDGTYSSSDGGNNANQVLVDAACTLYAIYLRKTGTTAVVFKATNHATTAQTNGTGDISHIITTSGQEILLTYPSGHALSAGLTMTENTTATGSTLTLLANRLDGFVIVGA